MGSQRHARIAGGSVRSRRCLALGLTVSCVVLVGCGGSSGAARFVVGRWHGELHQRAVAPFRITVTVGSLSTTAANRVRYTGINCGGHWTYLGTSGVTVRFREVIDSGRGGKCKGVGEVTLSREGPRLRYRFSGGGVVSRGLLSRG